MLENWNYSIIQPIYKKGDREFQRLIISYKLLLVKTARNRLNEYQGIMLREYQGCLEKGRSSQAKWF